jgi:hypothetical protein
MLCGLPDHEKSIHSSASYFLNRCILDEKTSHSISVNKCLNSFGSLTGEGFLLGVWGIGEGFQK